MQPEAKPTRFINNMHAMPGPQQRLHPGNKLARLKASRRLGPRRRCPGQAEAGERASQGVLVLRDDHVKLGVNIEPKFDALGA